MVEKRGIFLRVAWRCGETWEDREKLGGKGRKCDVVGSVVVGTTIIPGDDVGTRVIGGRKDRMLAQREERMEERRTRNAKWQEYWLRGTRPRTTKIIFSLTRSRRGNHRDGWKLLAGLNIRRSSFAFEPYNHKEDLGYSLGCRSSQFPRIRRMRLFFLPVDWL